MAVLPAKELDLITFCEAHDPVWSAAPTTIGLTAAQATAFDTLTKAARTKYNAAQSAREASKAATTALNASVASLRTNAADLVKFVKAYAASQPVPGTVYSAAQIPPPLAPVPTPPPGQPTNITVGLNPSGSITIKWKSVNAAASTGAFFVVRRKIGSGPSATFSQVASLGTKSFTDNTLPANVGAATYIIQGYRGLNAGPESDQFTVQLGSSGLTVTGLAIAA